MINLFGIDVTNNKDNLEQFKIREADIELVQKQEETRESMDKVEKKAALPTWLSILMYIALLAGTIIICGFIKALKNKSFKELISRPTNIFLLAIAVVLILAYIIYRIIAYQKAKVVAKSEEFNQVAEEIDEIVNESFKDLNIPDDKIIMDVFTYPYKVKKDKIKPASSMFKYINIQYNFFIEDDKLCFADIETVYAIPLSCFKRIIKYNKRAMVNGWNKDVEFNKGEYKEYKITKNNYDNLFMKPYYSVQFEYEFKEYEFLIPPYEINHLNKLLNLEIIDSKEEEKEDE